MQTKQTAESQAKRQAVKSSSGEASAKIRPTWVPSLLPSCPVPSPCFFSSITSLDVSLFFCFWFCVFPSSFFFPQFYCRVYVCLSFMLFLFIQPASSCIFYFSIFISSSFSLLFLTLSSSDISLSLSSLILPSVCLFLFSRYYC